MWHLHNRELRVDLILGREVAALRGAAANQLRILRVAGLRSLAPAEAGEAMRRADVVIDALTGYSLRGVPQARKTHRYWPSQ